jgi:AraC-like DNA-binding protein
MAQSSSMLTSVSDAAVGAPAFSNRSVVPTVTVLAVLDGFERLGFETERLRRDAAISETQLEQGEAVSKAAFLELWRGAELMSKHEALALELGLRLPQGTFGAVDYLAMSADTLGNALRILSDHYHAVSSERQLEIVETDTELRVLLRNREHPEVATIADDLTIGVLLNRFSRVCRPFQLLGVELCRSASSQAEAFSKLVGAPVRFECAATTLRFARNMRDCMLESRDARLHRTLRSLAVRSGLTPMEESFESVVRRQISMLLPSGHLSMGLVARGLGMSERSLQRRLAELNCAYQMLADSVRREEAERLLRRLERGHSIACVAQAVGFQDQAAFSRAFARWTGHSPRAWLALHHDS